MNVSARIDARRVRRIATIVALILAAAAGATAASDDALDLAARSVLAAGERSEELGADELVPPVVIVPFHSLDAGGGRGTAEFVQLFAAIGQPDAGFGEVDDFRLYGGFVPPERTLIFRDGFESANDDAW